MGVRAVERLAQEWELPQGVSLLDGGTAGMALFPRLEGVDYLMVIDALHSGRVPGSVVVLGQEALKGAFAARWSVHDSGVAELLAALALRGGEPSRQVELVGVEPLFLGWGLELSPVVRGALPGVMRAVQGVLTHWGFAPLRRRPQDQS